MKLNNILQSNHIYIKKTHSKNWRQESWPLYNTLTEATKVWPTQGAVFMKNLRRFEGGSVSCHGVICQPCTIQHPKWLITWWLFKSGWFPYYSNLKWFKSAYSNLVGSRKYSHAPMGNNMWNNWLVVEPPIWEILCSQIGSFPERIRGENKKNRPPPR